jgi:hypothetical protein
VRARCRLFGCYRKIWLEFPLWGSFGGFDPKKPPIRISNRSFNAARRDGNFEVFHVVVCRILHFRDVAYCWNSFIMGNPYFRSNFGKFSGDYSGVGSGMSTKLPKGMSLRQNTHFEPSCTFLRLSIRAGREPEKTGKKKSHNRYMSPMCPLKPA